MASTLLSNVPCFPVCLNRKTNSSTGNEKGVNRQFLAGLPMFKKTYVV